jgi:hypothetical protein
MSSSSSFSVGFIPIARIAQPNSLRQKTELEYFKINNSSLILLLFLYLNGYFVSIVDKNYNPRQSEHRTMYDSKQKKIFIKKKVLLQSDTWLRQKKIEGRPLQVLIK